MRDRAENINTGNFLRRGRVDDWVMEEVKKCWKNPGVARDMFYSS